MQFKGRTVLITGGSGGIGRATALAFAREGARIMLSDVNDEGGQAVLAELAALGAEAAYERADVSQAAQVESLVQATVARFGGLHIAVNNAGVSGSFNIPVHETTEDVYHRVMDINVKGVWLCMKYEVPALIASGGGSIINLASVAGLIGAPLGSIYCASKHAVVGLTRSAALEYARQDIRVNAICPSYIETPMVTDITAVDPRMAHLTTKASPMKRLGQPEEVASAIVWVASDGASYVNGTTLAIDGGLTAM